VAPGTVHEYVRRARAASLAWPLPMELDDGRLEAKLFAAPSPGPRPRPDLAFLHQELKRPGVTLLLLWQEYRAVHASGYSYSRVNPIPS
jgi:transposase